MNPIVAKHFRMSKLRSRSDGFSILEIIIFVTLISIILIAAIGYTVRVLRLTLINQHKILANHYVQEVQEWLAGERESVSWDQFEAKASTGAGTTYCMNSSLPINYSVTSLTSGGGCTFVGVGVTNPPNIFRRTLKLQKNTAATASRVTATIEVAWIEEGVTYIDTLQTVFSVWE